MHTTTRRYRVVSLSPRGYRQMSHGDPTRMPMTILYIDDDAEDIEIFRDAVKAVNPSIQYFAMNSAGEALAYLHESSTFPDYIFLDINMPGIDGKMCLTQLRSDARYNGIRVVVYSTNSFPKDIEEIQSLGATFTKKANSFTELCDIIRAL
jgi:CheY-like chemotaxis protein